MRRWGFLAATPTWLIGGAWTLDAAIRQSVWLRTDEVVE
jgi:hypothetical protein